MAGERQARPEGRPEGARASGAGLGAGAGTLVASSARAAERSGPAIQTPRPSGSLFNADMGYFTLRALGAIEGEARNSL
jgi:hypothetical protein